MDPGSTLFSSFQYYDWDENVCVHYEWFTNENYFKQVESDTEIPDTVSASPKSRYYPDLEPDLVEEMMVRKSQRV